MCTSKTEVIMKCFVFGTCTASELKDAYASFLYYITFYRMQLKRQLT